MQNPWKTLGFMKKMVYKIPPGGGGKPYPASGLKLKHVHYVKPSIYLPTKLIQESRTSVFVFRSLESDTCKFGVIVVFPGHINIFTEKSKHVHNVKPSLLFTDFHDPR